MPHNSSDKAMRPVNAWKVVWQVARKEMALFLASPIAWVFFISFAAITLFIVFWGEAFFARNIADVRPMFEWMPILLILLCSTVTMRMWSEERRTGTIEHVLTQAAPLWSFVVGKFIGCMLLLLLSLLVILPLPITISFISDIDWGPVWAGFLATVLLGAAYMAIGLFVSSRTQNQIVSLIGAIALCGVFWLIGHSVITGTLGQTAGELFRSLGTGQRFDAITRGVIDVGDLVYYISLTLVFLALTVYMLERERWAMGRTANHHRRWRWIAALTVLNALALNLWVGQIDTWRLDTTRGKQYTLSDATRNYLAQLQEPLTLRGYFSAKTHPLLSPLVPQMRDLLREYEVAGEGRVRVEFVDPMENPQAEEEANRQYGIEPVPFQVADRYQSSIVSSYFDVLVQYGNEFEVLGFRDLIDVKTRGETDIDVQLRNPEFDLTKSIRRVLTDFQTAGDVFNNIANPVTLHAYVSEGPNLPEELVSFGQELTVAVERIQAESGGKLLFERVDPDANGGQVAQQLATTYGLRPMSAGLFSTEQFWFHLLLSDESQVVSIPLDDLSIAQLENNLDAGLKRFASGFTRKVALVTAPQPAPQMMQQGMMSGGDYRTLEEVLRAEYDVVQEDLSDGSVSADADLLILAAPTDLDERALFAVDQFLMQGGTVIAATSKWSATLSRNRIDLQEKTSGLEQWLSHHGITIEDTLVMDPQNAAFPIPVTRNVGGLQLQEMRMLDYPWFVDIRQSGLSDDSPIVADLAQVTMAWSSPISLAESAAEQGEENSDNSERNQVVLLRSSDKAWLSESKDIMPRMQDGSNTLSPWVQEGEAASHILGVASTGRFDSWFAGKPSPIALSEKPSDDANSAETPLMPNTEQGDADAAEPQEPTLAENMDTVIERSPESARLVVFASNDFLRDQITQMAGSATGSLYMAPYQMIANSVDVALDDSGLLGIRSRGQFNRTLPPLASGSQKFWEYLNYVLAALAVAMLYGVTHFWRRRKEQQQLNWLAS